MGSVVSSALLSAGHEVRVLDSLMYGGQALLGLLPRDGFSFVAGDVRDEAAVKAALKDVDAVVHLAAIVGDPACSRNPQLAKEVNEKASLQLFGLAEKAGVKRFIFASTCSNYGRMLDPTQPLTETSDLRPVSLYAETKVAVEQALLASTSPIGVTLLRLATVYGISPRMRFDLTVNEFTMELFTKRSLKIFGGQFWRPYLHVRDAALMISLVLAAPADEVRGEVFNVGTSSENYQKQQLVELIAAEIGGDLAIEQVHKTEDPRDYKVSFEKARAFGFTATRTVPDGIREVLATLRQRVIVDGDDPKCRD